MIAFLLATALVLGPEKPVGDAPHQVPNPSSGLSLATDGHDVAAAWIDDRSGSNDVYRARFTPGGQVLDVTPVTSGVNATNARVIFDGRDFRVFWSDADAEWRLMDAAPLTAGGALLLERNRQYQLALRRDGSEARDVLDDNALTGKVLSNVVVWLSVKSGSTYIVYAQPLDANGSRVGLPSVIGTRGDIDLAAAPGLVIVQSGGIPTLFRVAPNGTLTKAGQLELLPTIDSIAATDDGGFVVAAHDLFRFDAAGRLVAIEHAADFAPRMVAVAGGEVVAVGNDLSSFQLTASVSGRRTVLAPRYDTQSNAAIASDGSDVLTLWKGEHNIEIPALTFDRDHYNAAFTLDDRLFVTKLGRGGVFLEPSREVGYADGRVSIGGHTAAWRNLLIQNRIALWNFDTQTVQYPDLAPGVSAVAVQNDFLAAITVYGDVIFISTSGARMPQAEAQATGDALAFASGLMVYRGYSGLTAQFLSNFYPVHLADDVIGQPAIAHDHGLYFVTWATSEGVFLATLDGHSAEIQPVSAGARNPAITTISGGAVVAYERPVKELGYTTRVFTRALFTPRKRSVIH